MEDHQRPVTELVHLDAVPVRERDGTIRVHVSDARCGLVLLSLTAKDAAYLGGSLVAASARAGRVGEGHDPGE